MIKIYEGEFADAWFDVEQVIDQDDPTPAIIEIKNKEGVLIGKISVNDDADTVIERMKSFVDNYELPPTIQSEDFHQKLQDFIKKVTQ